MAEMLLGPTYPTRSTPSARSCSRRSRCTRTSPRTRSTTCSPRRSSAGIRSGRRVLGGLRSSAPFRSLNRRLPPCPLHGVEIVVAAAGNVEHERSRARRAPRRSRRPARHGAGGRPRRSTAPVGFQRKETEQYHICFGGPGSTAATSAATRSASSTRSSAARPPRASSARCARSAASPTRSAPTRSSTSTADMVAHLRRHPRGQRRRRPANHRPRARVDPLPRASPRRSSTRAKERVKERMVLSSSRPLPACLATPVGPLRHPLLSLDQLLENLDALTSQDVAGARPRALYVPDRSPLRTSRRVEHRVRSALAPVSEASGRGVDRGI